MSILSDVQALYGTVRNTWAKSQVHIISHIVLVVVVFVVCRASIPEMAMPKMDAGQVVENEWFKLGKDTGLIYATLLIPVIVIAMYAAVLRAAGHVLVAILMVLFPPSPRGGYRLLSSTTLEPLALALNKKDFEMADLYSRSNQLVLKYQGAKSEAWESYQQSLGAISKNAQIYLGDFLAFVLIWYFLFKLLPHADWIQANETHFRSVIVILLALAWFAWFRVSRALAVLPSLLLIVVCASIPK
jgi:hypothetical protein